MKAIQRRGSATTAAVFVLAAVLIGAGVWYFVSDPFRTKVDASMKQATTWTPENIAKDPQNYLNYCETETNAAIVRLKASKIAVAQNRAQLEQMRSDAQAQVDTGTKAVSELLTAYKSADSSNVWPVSWNNQTMDKDKLKGTVVSLSKQVSTQQMLLSKCDAGLKSLDAQDSKIDQAQGDAQTQLAEIKTNRELLNVQSLTTDLKDKLVSMNAAVGQVVNAANDSGGTVSLAQLTADSAAAVDNTAFDKILANSNSK